MMMKKDRLEKAYPFEWEAANGDRELAMILLQYQNHRGEMFEGPFLRSLAEFIVWRKSLPEEHVWLGILGMDDE